MPIEFAENECEKYGLESTKPQTIADYGPPPEGGFFVELGNLYVRICAFSLIEVAKQVEKAGGVAFVSVQLTGEDAGVPWFLKPEADAVYFPSPKIILDPRSE